MFKYNIFLDTNVIQHTINHPDKDKILELHKKNLNFYNKNTIYLVPQVITELRAFHLSFKDGLGKLLKLNLDMKYDISKYFCYLLNDLYNFILDGFFIYKDFIKEENKKKFILEYGDEKHERYIKFFKKNISNGIFWIENTSWKEYNQDLQNKYFGFCEKNLGDFISKLDFNYKDEISDNIPSMAYGEIVEGTNFGKKLYYGFTHRDISRTIGNFLRDYKNYSNKGEKQQQKVGKDSLIFFQILFGLNNIDLSKEKIILITSDKDFFKEFNKFIGDVKNGLFDTEKYYLDLSDNLKKLANDLSNNITIIYLNINDFLFEDINGKKDTDILKI